MHPATRLCAGPFYCWRRRDATSSWLLHSSPNDDPIKELLGCHCTVYLIVKLGPGTDAGALRRIVDNSNIHLRFFTSPEFHTKLYIVGQHEALVGSANLTKADVSSNRELAITVAADDARFDDLITLFESYWDASDVLTSERCAKYAELQKTWSHHQRDPLEERVIKEFGDVAPKGIQVGVLQPTTQKLYMKSYHQVYDEFLRAYRLVEERYRLAAQRKKPGIPLTIEIDQFFSFVREKFATGEKYKLTPLRKGNDLESFIDQHLAIWFSEYWEYLDLYIPDRYSRINSILGKPESIQKADANTLFDAIEVCHSVRDRFRFFPGGINTLRQEFLKRTSSPRFGRR